jgi:hypothetical protein
VASWMRFSLPMDNCVYTTSEPHQDRPGRPSFDITL